MADQLYTLAISGTQYGLLLDPSHVGGVTELLSSSYGSLVRLHPVAVTITDPATLSGLLRDVSREVPSGPVA